VQHRSAKRGDDLRKYKPARFDNFACDQVGIGDEHPQRLETPCDFTFARCDAARQADGDLAHAAIMCRAGAPHGHDGAPPAAVGNL